MDDQQDGAARPEHEDLGSLAEEALKLAGAFTQWASTHGADLGRHVHDVGDQAREAWHEVDEHLATGSAECTVCPVCRTVSAVREVAPEVKEHLGAAAGSLLAAASGLLSAWSTLRAEPPTGPSEDSERASRVQDITLDDAPDQEA